MRIFFSLINEQVYQLRKHRNTENRSTMMRRLEKNNLGFSM